MTASNFAILRRLIALAIPVGVFLSLAACRVDDGPTGLLIRQAQDLQSGSSSCTVPASATATMKSEGVLDVTIPSVGENGYLFYPLVENQLGPFSGLAGADESLVEEKNNVILTAFLGRLSVANGEGFAWPEGCGDSFDYEVVTQMLPPGGSASAIVKLIQPCNAMAIFQVLDAEWQAGASPIPFVVKAKVRAKGHLGSGTIESPPFYFNVRVCYGCLQTEYTLPEAIPFRFPHVAKCSDLTTNPYVGEPCNPAQDIPILCCADTFDADGQTTSIQCPGVPIGADGK